MFLYKQLRTKKGRIKIGQVEYHNLESFFVIYFAYINVSVVHKEFSYLLP